MQRTQDGSSYGYFNEARTAGPSIAAGKGAVGYLIRSVGTDSHRFPHTGSLRYQQGVPRIPALALSNPDADQLERIAGDGKTLSVRIKVESSEVPAAQSGNVIAEVVGREVPEEIVVIGAHLDSWDLGTGAIDDGAGVGITMAALELIKDAGLAPRRTIRLVLWGAEEVGLLGANAYRDRYEAALGQHVIGSESDFGGGRVWKVTADSRTDAGDALFAEIARLLAPIGIAPGSDNQPGGGPDLYPLIAAGVPTLRLHQDGRDYFDLHHTADDTVDKLDAASLDQNVAAFAVFAWLAADSEVSFRAPGE
jgi:Zn-dependent M28 family amino/carboxypeptidase